MQKKAIAFLFTGLFTLSAFAQTAVSETQRNVNQQKRIEKGLQSGELNTKEAARLERGQSKIYRAESNAMKDGTLSSAEKERIDSMQDRASKKIHAEKHDAQKGNPDSASSRRMQADVQKNVEHQKRIRNGLANGSLTAEEAAKLQRSEAAVTRKEARAGRDGHVGDKEHHHIQNAEHRASQRIHRQKHDAQRGN